MMQMSLREFTGISHEAGSENTGVVTGHDPERKGYGCSQDELDFAAVTIGPVLSSA